MQCSRRRSRGGFGHLACSTLGRPRASFGRTFAARAPGRNGLTLVELLVSVTLTLLVVFAIVQVFSMLGETMTKGRATIEMAGNLRAVANRLQEDLDNLTCPVRPWIDPAAGQGYFEYVEGLNVGIPNVIRNPPCRGSDVDAYNASLGRPATNSRIAIGNNFWPGPDGIVDATPGQGQQTHFGDLDDVLLMTIKAANEPFRGRVDLVDGDPMTGYQVLESEYAEVIWWASIDSATNSVVLHRRQLLIVPSLNNTATGLVYGPFTSSPFLTPQMLKRFMHANDLSVRIVTNNTGVPIGLAANSLGDLTTPRNRFGHFRINRSISPTYAQAAPFEPISNPLTSDEWAFMLDWRYLSESLDPSTGTALSPNHLVLGAETFNAVSDRRGDDVVLPEVLAFDLRAYEPKAPLMVIDGSGIAMGSSGFNPATSQAVPPGSPGYDFRVVNNQISNGLSVPRGAFVDLMYGDYHLYQPNGAAPATVYGELGVGPAELVVGAGQGSGISPPYLAMAFYSTWSEGLEHDGIDQDNSGIPDQATDGLDNDNASGVDDYDERETRPPYNVPLTGIEVRIRMLEPSTRQIRQVSVVGDFTD